MATFQYRVEPVKLNQPAGGSMILQYEKQDQSGVTLPSIDDLGKDGWELIYLQPNGQISFLAIFKKATP